MAAIAEGVRATVGEAMYAAASTRGRHLDPDAVLALAERAAAGHSEMWLADDPAET